MGLRRRRNAGGHMWECGLMEIYRILRLHRFTVVPTPGSGGWWIVSSRMETERRRGGRGGRLVLPLGVLCKKKRINTLTKSILQRKRRKALLSEVIFLL